MAVKQIPPKLSGFKQHQSLIIFYCYYGQEFGSNSARWFWLGVSHEVAVRWWLWLRSLSKASSLMSSIWSGKTQIAENWASRGSLTISVETLHVTATTWRLRVTWTSYKLVQGSQGTYSRREKESQEEIYGIFSEVTQLHFYSILLVRTMINTKVCVVQAAGTWSPSLSAGVSMSCCKET